MDSIQQESVNYENVLQTRRWKVMPDKGHITSRVQRTHVSANPVNLRGIRQEVLVTMYQFGNFRDLKACHKLLV